MKLSDLDDSTRLLIFRATLMAKYPDRPTALADLQEAVEIFDEEHGDEMLANLLVAIFDETMPDEADDKDGK